VETAVAAAEEVEEAAVLVLSVARSTKSAVNTIQTATA
jgi:hypothetical protein